VDDLCVDQISQTYAPPYRGAAGRGAGGDDDGAIVVVVLGVLLHEEHEKERPKNSRNHEARISLCERSTQPSQLPV